MTDGMLTYHLAEHVYGYTKVRMMYSELNCDRRRGCSAFFQWLEATRREPVSEHGHGQEQRGTDAEKMTGTNNMGA